MELPELSRRRDTGTRKDWGIWNRLGRCGWGLGPVRRLVVGTEQGRDGQSTSGHSLSQLRPATAGLKRRERKVRRRWVRGRSESGRGIHAQSHDVRPEVTSPSPRKRNHFPRRRQSPFVPFRWCRSILRPQAAAPQPSCCASNVQDMPHCLQYLRQTASTRAPLERGL